MPAHYTVDRFAWFAKRRALTRKDGSLGIDTVNITQGIAENPGFLVEPQRGKRLPATYYRSQDEIHEAMDLGSRSE